LPRRQRELCGRRRGLASAVSFSAFPRQQV
jgi:hypothetical protein